MRTATEADVFATLLKQALAELDTIAAEPTPYETDRYLANRYREIATGGAKCIRDKLKAHGYKP